MLAPASVAQQSTGRVVLLVNLASFLSQVVQVGSFPVFVPLALARLGTSEATIGLVAALPWICVLLLARPSAALIEWLGYKVTALAGLGLTLGAVLAFLVLRPGSAGIVALSVVVGAGLILRWIACDAWIIHVSRDDRRGRFVGIHESLMGLGIATGPLLLLLTDGADGGYLLAACLVVIGAGVLFQAAPSPDPTPQNTANHGTGGGTRALFLLLALTVMGAALSGYVETSTIALLPLYLQSEGLPTGLSLLYLSAFGLGGTLLQYPIGHVVDVIGTRPVQILLAAVTALGAIYVSAAVGPLPLDLAALFLWGGAVGGLNTVAVIAAGAPRSGSAQVARSLALIASAYTVGSIAGPAVSGWLWHRIAAWTLFAAFALAALAYAVTLLLRRPAKNRSP